MENLTEREQAYINRPLEEENMSFESWSKFQDLRDNTLKQRSNLNFAYKLREIQENDRVKFTIDDVNYMGYVVKVNKVNCVVKCSGEEYVVEKSKLIHQKPVEDLSHVKIPEVLTKFNTKALLRLYRTCKFKTYNEDMMVGTQKVRAEQIKAELNKRENIFNKKEKSILRRAK